MMDEQEIEELEAALSGMQPEIEKIDPTLTIADFCLDSVKKLMASPKGAPTGTFHVLHKGSVYYIDMVVRAIAPPYEAREPGKDKQQWFGQRPS